MNSIVSGALDRLHYEQDPCVKYDAERKLWLYLHKYRRIDFEGWKIPFSSEEPNTLENNSFNPLEGTEQGNIWKDSLHSEKSLI